MPASTVDQYLELRPEIADIPSEVYNRLSKLLMRILQECYNDPTATLHTMADIPLVLLANGALPNGLELANSQENAEVNKRKKLFLLKFAQDNRSKFIKLLVLTEWGKNAAVNISKLIDLFQWTNEQRRHVDLVDVQLQRIKEKSNRRENYPHIASALEILSTSKAS
jgi:mediator of RNA polymerase II transcription subunit 14